jgi:methyl-accepting chemotaxis protein
MGLCVVLLAIVGTVCAVNFHRSRKDVSTTAAAIPKLLIAEQIQARTAINYGLMLKHILSSTDSEIASLDKAMKELSAGNNADAKAYQEQLATAEERKLYAEYERTRDAYRTAREPAIEASRRKDDAKAYQLFQADVDPARTAYSKAIDNIVAYNEKVSKDSLSAIESTISFSTVFVLVSVAVSLVLAGAVSTVIIRSVRKTLVRISQSLSDGASQVSSASSQVSSSAQSLAQGASEQAASLEESNGSIQEMASMIRKNADTGRQAATFSGDAKTASDRGTEAMSSMNAAILDIEQAASATAKIVRTIDEIAFQTNLLALNAAVEAARAGESGKGFAVVAEEVRNLAMRSAEAAKNTSSLIEQSVQKAKNGVAIAQTVATNLQQINDATTRTSGLIAEIAASGGEQATGIDQISAAAGRMEQVTQTNAANAEESAAASEELNAQAEQLLGCVRELQSLVGMTGSPAGSSRKSTSAPVPNATHGQDHKYSWPIGSAGGKNAPARTAA